eukprot:CAMPEP_0181056846 /NCGR_PEP_ID=MMETSP1070-20121207/19934_1 /TAXON_ID=265543 /ORGANISM="Minutocellus polymorphus, Strain NH13" /LENGTH=190 /DNA_ID=CAMNT_0023136219 /DNA_START=142 /DNA_END=714 /DNA_ORIENTATION=-
MFLDELDRLEAKPQSPMESGDISESPNSERIESLLLGSRIKLVTAKESPTEPADLLLPFERTVQSVFASCLDSSMLDNRLWMIDARFLVVLTNEADLPVPPSGLSLERDGAAARFGLDGLEDIKLWFFICFSMLKSEARESLLRRSSILRKEDDWSSLMLFINFALPSASMFANGSRPLALINIASSLAL